MSVSTLTLFRMGRGDAQLPTSFFRVNSTNVGISPQNFLTLSFSASPQLLNLNQDHPSKKWFFWSKILIKLRFR